MFFNLFFILQLVLRILHVLHQILTQSTPNSQQIKLINLVNKPTQIKPKSRNQSQQTQKNIIKPRSHHHWPTESNHHPADQTKDPPHRSVTKPTELVTKPTDQSTNPRQQSNQTHYHHRWSKKREEKGFRNHQQIGQRPRSSSILSKPPLALFLDLLQIVEKDARMKEIKWTHNQNHKNKMNP